MAPKKRPSKHNTREQKFPAKKSISEALGTSKACLKRSQHRNYWVFGYDLELESQDEWAGYKNMLVQEQNRILNNEKCYPLEIGRVERIAEAIRKLNVPEHEKTNFLALAWLKSCLQLGILPPPWVADRILEVIEGRYQKKIESLDSAFGFTGKGRGQGKRVAELDRFLHGTRNKKIGQCVLALIILGDNRETAVRKVAHCLFFHNKEQDLNSVPYNLFPIRIPKGDYLNGLCPFCLSKKMKMKEKNGSLNAHDQEVWEEAGNREMQMESRINRIYGEWLSNHPQYENPEHPYHNKVLTQWRNHFEEHFSFIS